MDVFDIIMEFLFGYSFKPSAALLKKYSESKLTREFNAFPPLEHLNSKFIEYIMMSEEEYERLRKILDSRPPFVFYFNPNIELRERVHYDCCMIGFIGDDVSANKWNIIQV